MIEDVPEKTSAEQVEQVPKGEGIMTLIPKTPIITVHSEELITSLATSALVADLKSFMTQVAVNIETKMNVVMNALEERKEKDASIKNSIATLFDIVKKGEAERRKEREERKKQEAERLAREAEEEIKREEHLQEMLRIAAQFHTSRSPSSTSTNPPPPPPPP